MSARLPAFAVVTALASLPGCATPVNQNQCNAIVPIELSADDGGLLLNDGGLWETADPYNPNALRLPYAAYTTYRVFHRLGHAPTTIPRVLASFEPNGILAEQIGNVAEFLPSCDDAGYDAGASVLVRNAGGQDFYVVIQLQ